MDRLLKEGQLLSMKLALRLTTVEVETEEDVETDAAGGVTNAIAMLSHVLREEEDLMRQKYQIYLNAAGTRLNIKELAIIDRHLNRSEPSMLEDKSFCLLCEETYDIESVTNSIAVGIADLVTTLRTINFFPNHRYATMIAEAVVKLFASRSNGKIEMILDDKDMIPMHHLVVP